MSPDSAHDDGIHGKDEATLGPSLAISCSTNWRSCWHCCGHTVVLWCSAHRRINYVHSIAIYISPGNKRHTHNTHTRAKYTATTASACAASDQTLARRPENPHRCTHRSSGLMLPASSAPADDTEMSTDGLSEEQTASASCTSSLRNFCFISSSTPDPASTAAYACCSRL